MDYANHEYSVRQTRQDLTRTERDLIQDNQSRDKIQRTIDAVAELFLWARVVDSPSTARLGEMQWKNYAKGSNYHYPTDAEVVTDSKK